MLKNKFMKTNINYYLDKKTTLGTSRCKQLKNKRGNRIANIITDTCNIQYLI